VNTFDFLWLCSSQFVEKGIQLLECFSMRDSSNAKESSIQIGFSLVRRDFLRIYSGSEWRQSIIHEGSPLLGILSRFTAFDQRFKGAASTF
jgi:hypothetical protein